MDSHVVYREVVSCDYDKKNNSNLGKLELLFNKSKKFRPKGRGMENVLLANPWFPLQAYIFRPKGRGITPKLLLNS